MTDAGPLHPPTESVPPFTGRQWFTDDRGVRIGECWDYEPMCAMHAGQVINEHWRENRAAKERQYQERVRPYVDPAVKAGDVALACLNRAPTR